MELSIDVFFTNIYNTSNIYILLYLYVPEIIHIHYYTIYLVKLSFYIMYMFPDAFGQFFNHITGKMYDFMGDKLTK